MRDMMGIVMADNSELRLNELTELRSGTALPFGGRYRLIDFILSNMVNSGIINVGITTSINYSSLMDHVGSGAPWDLNRKIYGLFILPPYVRGGVGGISAGSIDQLYGVLTFLRRSRQQYVLLASGRTVCNMTFDEALNMHIEKDADITVIYLDRQKKDSQLSRSTVYEVDNEGRVTAISANMSRINAVFRRAGGSVSSQDTSAEKGFAIGSFRVDAGRYMLVDDSGNEEPLTMREMGILRLLAETPGNVIDRDRIFNEVWGQDYQGTTRTLDQYIAQLRRKLGSAGDCIEAVRGAGYRYVSGSQGKR